jgi:hypothetical protein
MEKQGRAASCGLDFMPLSEKVSVGGHEFTVSALPCGAVRREVMPLARELGGAAGDPAAFLEGDLLDRLLKLCHRSVSKADPSMTLEALDGCLMLADVAELFGAVVRVSGLVRGAAPGEARGQGTRPSSGETSTATSQPPPAGPTPTSTKASPSRRPRN